MEISLVAPVARRVAVIAKALAEAHELGVEPGAVESMATVRYQRSVLSIYRATLPPGYIVKVAQMYETAAGEMRLRDVPGGSRACWKHLEDYLVAVSTVFAESCPAGGECVEVELPEKPSPIIQYGHLASTVTPQAVHLLGASASAVLSFCETPMTTGKELDEERLVWLRRLSHGERVLDMAADLGYSERSMYRQLGTLWRAMGVQNRAEAIAEAGRQGLI